MSLAVSARQIVARAVKTFVQAFAGAWLGLNIALNESTWTQIKTGLLIAVSAGALSLATNLAVIDPPTTPVPPPTTKRP
jgi:hypothetical protein